MLVPPRITEKPRRIVVKSGQPAELWCEAVGIPKPHITWLKDDKALSQSLLIHYHYSIILSASSLSVTCFHLSLGNV